MQHIPPPVEVADRFANFNIDTGKVMIAGYNTDRRLGVRSYNGLFENAPPVICIMP